MNIAIGVIAIVLGVILLVAGAFATFLGSSNEASDVSGGLSGGGCLVLVVGLALLGFGIWFLRTHG